MHQGRTPGVGREQASQGRRWARSLALAACWLLAGDPALAAYGKFVLTGAPGAGKTTILKELRARGFLTVDEAYTVLHQRAAAEGTLAAFLAEPATLHRSMWWHQAGLEAALSAREPVFLDRGAVDICYYGRLKNLPGLGSSAGDPAPGSYDLVFYVDPLPEALFERTGIRDLSYAQAREENEQLVAHYQRHGYRANLVRVPFGAPAQRADFILHTIREWVEGRDVQGALDALIEGGLYRKLPTRAVFLAGRPGGLDRSPDDGTARGDAGTACCSLAN